MRLFLDEVDEAERLVRINPHIGVVYATHASGNVLRLLLSKTKRHFYYRYRVDRDEVTVLAVWGARRERSPQL